MIPTRCLLSTRVVTRSPHVRFYCLRYNSARAKNAVDLLINEGVFGLTLISLLGYFFHFCLIGASYASKNLRQKKQPN